MNLNNGTNPTPGAGTTATSGVGSYRLASLDRLAMRHRLYNSAGTNADAASNAAPDSNSSSIASAALSKRELFFKNDHSAQSNNSTTTVSANSSTTSLVSSGRPPVPSKENVMALDDNRFKDSAREKDNPPSGASTNQNRRKEVDGYVGFANLPNQVYRKAVKKGFDFTLMVLGESGLGKSTLINSLFLADIYSAEHPGPSQRTKKTVQVETSKVLLKENGVNLTLTVVDTPGFGDAVDNTNCWQPVMDYIEARFEDYLNFESRVGRSTSAPVPDGRVHCCLYFISPGGHGLKPLDIEVMRRLHDKVNIVPVIAKADTLMPDECARFKKQILNEIAQHRIRLYEFPDCDDPEENKSHRQLKERLPFAVVGSNVVVEGDNGRKIRGRRYPWGIVEVENLEHCDFLALRNLLIRTHMQDLKEVTNNVHYENFRVRKLAGMGSGDATAANNVKGKAGIPSVNNQPNPRDFMNCLMVAWNPLAQMEEEKRDHENKMRRMESEMEQVFEMKVKEKRQKLKDSELELQKRHDQMRRTLEAQQRDLEERRRAFEAERVSWEQSVGVTIEELRRRSLEANSKEHVDGKVKEKKKKGLF